MKSCSVIVADDHALVRDGLLRILDGREDLRVIAEVGDGLELLKLLERKQPRLILLDISMPHVRGIEIIPEIKRISPETKILVLTMHRDAESMRLAIGAGADGYLLKDDAGKDLFAAIDSVLQGGVYISRFLAEESRESWVHMLRGTKAPGSTEVLTVREREVLKLIAEGKSNKEAAYLLSISSRTVERHRANLMLKLNARNTADLVRYAVAKGFA